MKYIKTFENIDYDKKLIFLEDAFVEVKEISALFKIEHIFFETNTSKKKIIYLNIMLQLIPFHVNH